MLASQSPWEGFKAQTARPCQARACEAAFVDNSQVVVGTAVILAGPLPSISLDLLDKPVLAAIWGRKKGQVAWVSWQWLELP